MMIKAKFGSEHPFTDSYVHAERTSSEGTLP